MEQEERLQALYDEIVTLADQQRFRDLVRRAVAFLEAWADLTPLDRGRIFAYVCGAYANWSPAYATSAEDYGERAVKLLSAADVSSERTYYGLALVNLAHAHFWRGRLAPAIRAAKTAAEASSHPAVAIQSRQWLARFYEMLREYPTALGHAQEALAICRRHRLGQPTFRSLSQVAEMLTALGDFKEAEQTLKEADRLIKAVDSEELLTWLRATFDLDWAHLRRCTGDARTAWFILGGVNPEHLRPPQRIFLAAEKALALLAMGERTRARKHATAAVHGALKTGIPDLVQSITWRVIPVFQPKSKEETR